MTKSKEVELWEQLVACAKASKKFEEMSDKEIAAFVLDQVWAHTSLLSPANDLLSSIIARLVRADGGPCEEEDLSSAFGKLDEEE